MYILTPVATSLTVLTLCILNFDTKIMYLNKIYIHEINIIYNIYNVMDFVKLLNSSNKNIIKRNSQKSYNQK